MPTSSLASGPAAPALEVCARACRLIGELASEVDETFEAVEFAMIGEDERPVRDADESNEGAQSASV